MATDAEVTSGEKTTTQELNVETVKAFLESNEEGKKFINSLTDSRITKAIKTFETDTVPKLVDKKVKELYPQETEEQKQLRQLTVELENIRGEAKREKLHSLALTEATKRQLPTNLVKFFIGTDEESTLKNVEEFEKEFVTTVSSDVEAKFRTGGRRVPQQSTETRMTVSHDDVAQMSSADFKKHADAINKSLNK